MPSCASGFEGGGAVRKDSFKFYAGFAPFAFAQEAPYLASARSGRVRLEVSVSEIPVCARWRAAFAHLCAFTGGYSTIDAGASLHEDGEGGRGAHFRHRK